MTKATTVLIRADALRSTGSGHLMRMLAFTQALRSRGVRVCFVSRIEDGALAQRVFEQGCRLENLGDPSPEPGSQEDADFLLGLAKQYSVRWIVTDGYYFDTDYQRRIKEDGYHLLCVDDIASCHYVADAVVNQNVHAKEEAYSRDPETRLFLGPRYSFVREDFLSRSCDFVREIPAQAENILVTMGGSDPENVTARVLHALGKCRGKRFQIKVVLGALNEHVNEVRGLAAEQGHDIEILCDLNDGEMSCLMRWADLAVTACGSILWEFAFFSVPVLAVAIAGNQRLLLERLNQMGAVFSAGCSGDIEPGVLSKQIDALCADARTRERLSSDLRETVFPRRTGEVADLVAGAKREGVSLRDAGPEDCRLLFDWVNDEQVRRNSVSQHPVSWETHKKWFEEKISSPRTCRIFIARGETGALGEIRFDREGRSAMVDISVAAGSRGQGVGSWLLRQGAQKILTVWPDLAELTATVKSDNTASQKTFVKNGFRLQERGPFYKYVKTTKAQDQ